MKKLISVLLLCLSFVFSQAQIASPEAGKLRRVTVNGLEMLIWAPEGWDTATVTKYPLILVHVGNGVTDSASCTAEGLAKKIRLGWKATQKIPAGTPYAWGDTARFLVAIFKHRDDQGWGATEEAQVNYMVNNYKIDTNYLFTTGYSEGSYEQFNFRKMNFQSDATITTNGWKWYAKFNVIHSVASCGTGNDPTNDVRIQNVRFRINHGTNDGTCTINNAKADANYVNGLHAGNKAWVKEMATGNHFNIVDSAYSTAGPEDSTNNIFIWMIQSIDGTGAANIDPVANAGVDQSVTIPLTPSATLDGTGSSDADGTITGYLWTKVSGPAGGTITSPTSATTTVTSLAVGVYTYQLEVTDDDAATDTDIMTLTVSASRCSSVVKIDIHGTAQIYDLTGAASNGAGQGPEFFFDGPEDPLNGSNGTSSTGGNATTAIGIQKHDVFYKWEKGHRWDIDLGRQYIITDVYLYSKGANQDTLDIYFGDSLYDFNKLVNINDEPLQIRAISDGSTGWESYVRDDSTRRIRIRYKSAWFSGNPFPSESFTNIVIYGCPKTDAVVVPIVRKAPAKLKTKVGTNIAGQIFPLATHFPYMNSIRTYSMVEWWDSQSQPYPVNKYNFNYFNNAPGSDGYDYNSDLMAMGKRLFTTQRGASKWLIDQGKSGEYWNIDSVVDDPEKTSSWERAADGAWHFGAVYGDNTAIGADTNNIRLYNYPAGPKPFATNQFWGFEDGNEDNGFFKTSWMNDIVYVARASMIRDGNNQEFNARHGIKTSAPNMKYIMSGTVGVNHRVIKARAYLSMMLRGESLWDVFNVHEYWSIYDEDIIPISNQQIGNRGTYPEDDSAYVKYDSLPNILFRILGDTNFVTTLSEYGNDATYQFPEDASEVDALVTQFGTRAYEGMPDSLHSSALGHERDVILLGASRIDMSQQYLYHDLVPINTPDYKAAYVASGQVQYTLAKKPMWYMYASLVNRFGEWVFDTVITKINGGLYYTRGYHPEYTDSVVHIVWKADTLTGGGVAYNINVGSVTGAKKFETSYTSEIGTESTASNITNGIMSGTVGLKPEYYTMRIAGATRQRFKFKGILRFKTN
jgi:hypothetical protein